MKKYLLLFVLLIGVLMFIGCSVPYYSCGQATYTYYPAYTTTAYYKPHPPKRPKPHYYKPYPNPRPTHRPKYNPKPYNIQKRTRR